MSQQDYPHTTTADQPQQTPTLGRRHWLALGGGALAAGVTGSLAAASPAGAAPATQAWLCGGNSNIAGSTNYIGVKNAAPLIFKTTPSGGATTERMRITATGKIGVGNTAPTAALDVATAAAEGAVRGVTTSTAANSVGVVGTADSGTGVSGTSAGNIGTSGKGGYAGVQGTGGSYGGILTGTSVGGYGNGSDYGLYGAGGTYGAVASGSDYGAYGTGATGVRGLGSTYGVHGSTSNPNTDAVRGEGGQWGVHGLGGRTAGVIGESGYVGTWGQATSYGVYGLATDPTNPSYGLFGQASNGASYALYAQGNARVTGTLSKAAGSFKIDHPLDPERKWLSHSFVESPDMMNVYNGTVTLDDRGESVVRLPTWFDALNRDFRYQLTAIGAPAPDLHVKREIANNRFRIGGGTPGGKVSWQVTGIRQDDYAQAHPIVVEERKSGSELGTRQFVPAGSKAKAHQPLVSPRAVHEPGAEPALPPAPSVPDLRR
ncbi:MAG: hypothetical protein U0R80_08745 [Nocardioidaceae bacterium]